LSLATTKCVAVELTELEYTSVGEKSYRVRFTSKSQPSSTFGFRGLLWLDRKHAWMDDGSRMRQWLIAPYGVDSKKAHDFGDG
jgi:hypothetical protein